MAFLNKNGGVDETLDDGSQVTVTIPVREADTASALEKLKAALKRARAEVARSRNDAA